MEPATVSVVLRRYAEQYLERFSRNMPGEQRKVLRAVTACRTGSLGVVRYRCAQCGETHVTGRSCGNRHCVLCQKERTQTWLAKQESKLLPCPYFFITFTVPPRVQRVMRRHPRAGYEALFQASSQALKVLAANERHVGTTCPGFFGVLHTWGRDLSYHPHIHYVVAGGGLSTNGQEWKSSRVNYYVPDTALATVFRAKLRDEFRARGLIDEVDPSVWQQTFIINCRAVGDGRSTLKYLAAYVFRVAVTEQRITHCDWHPDMDTARVRLLVKRSGTERDRPMTLSVTEFLRRYLQHVLPRGFHKVRHYGFLSPASRMPWLLLAWLVAVANQRVMDLCRTQVLAAPPPLPRACPACGGVLVLQEIVLPTGRRIRIRPPPGVSGRGSCPQEPAAC